MEKRSLSAILSLRGFTSYEEYLRSPAWINFKAKYRESGLPTSCLVCSAENAQLHHKTYVRICREKLNDVVPLCDRHHSYVHRWLKHRGLPVEKTESALRSLATTRKKPKSRKDTYRRKHTPQNWSDPLSAIRMLGNGQQMPLLRKNV